MAVDLTPSQIAAHTTIPMGDSTVTRFIGDVVTYQIEQSVADAIFAEQLINGNEVLLSRGTQLYKFVEINRTFAVTELVNEIPEPPEP